MLHRRRVWSEEVPLSEVGSPAVLAICRRFEVDLIVAVRPGGEEGVGRLLARAEDAGVGVALWPMLADEDGRWASAGNASRFAAFTLGLVDRVAREGRAVREIALDLEPQIEDVRALRVSALLRRGSRARLAVGRRELASLCAGLADRGVVVSAAAVPLVLFDESLGEVWQGLLGTPIDGLDLAHVSFMLYTSILEGWSRGLLDRAAVRALLGAGAMTARRRFGDRAGLSLGAVGVGAFGDEPVYRSPRELADDVAITRAAGVDDLTLLDLGGVLARETPEAWLEAFVSTPAAPSVPRLDFASGAAIVFTRLVTHGLSLLLA